MTRLVIQALLATAIAAVPSTPLGAHDGPPFPIVSKLVQGAYEISVWTDPDTTDDGEPGGQFWVILDTAGGAPPTATLVDIAIWPTGGDGQRHSTRAAPVDGDLARQFAALVMDHEGRFGVEVTVTGPLGRAVVTSAVDATYDLRPPPMMIALYLLPFAVIGLLWLKLIVARRRDPRRVTGTRSSASS